ncbi:MULTISPECIES: acetolactate synthase large subunit [unclassified Thioalkalivibrio]|uniref:acetolactate synthase large subunit n=1 Tax=unclassified Thioalkalivibrio TaxID=2621013 RepID=UPI00037F8202|nr:MULTISPECIES: acetolactate synthase large subunit [unclassified Thioalkalivibrio]
MSTTVTTAQRLVECLEQEQVERVFGLPGEENMAVLDALADSPIEFITTRHEQGAAFMADVHGRLSGHAGVCLATLGPGATNLITGVADANMDHAPLVAIAGQASTHRLHKESHQVLDLKGLFQPITKYSSSVVEPEILPEVVRKAFKWAEGGKPGASFIELPENVAALPCPNPPLPAHAGPEAVPAEASLEAAARLLNSAQHPLILAGNGVIRSGASGALSQLASALNIPVANTFMAKGVLPFRHPLALGSVGLQSQDFVNFGFHKADVIVCIGYDLVEYPPKLWHPTGDRTLIHIDSAPAEVDGHYNVSAEVIGDLNTCLARLMDLVDPREETILRPLRQSLIDDMNEHCEDTQFPLKPQKLIWDLRTAAELDAVVITDVGAHKLWMARMFRCELPNTCLISNGFASMGIALPGAIAAAQLYPERQVIAVTGDAGFLMNVQELETAVRLGQNFVVLIWNDNAYGLIEWKQVREYGRKAFVDFGNPDFVQLARSFGASGVRIGPDDSLEAALREALAAPGVTIIDCPVDYSENLKLTERLGELVCPF